MATRRDEALVLRRTPYGESSLVVQVLTRRHGRVHVLAKGAYRRSARYYCVLDLFDTLELEWSEPRDSQLALLRAGALVRRRRGPTADLETYRAALCVLELVELASRPAQVETALFALAERALDGLDGCPGPEGTRLPPDLTLVEFELGFLQNLGLAPALEACAACGGPAPPVRGRRAAFSAGAGGRLCRTHEQEARRTGRRVGTLPLGVLEAAAAIAGPLQGGARDRVLRDRILQDRVLRDRVRDFVERFMDYHLETCPASHRAFLAVPNRNAPRATTTP